jgi:mannosyltransferase OCH1-like enzyme
MTVFNNLMLNFQKQCFNLVAEFFKCKGTVLKERIHKLIIQTWEKEQMPEDWNMGLILPIFKNVRTTEELHC